jgi:hypothetical protein
MVLCAAAGWACEGFSAAIRFTQAATTLLNKKRNHKANVNRYLFVHTVEGHFLIQSNG